MRVLYVFLCLAFAPFVAGVSQSTQGSNCDNGQGDLHRSADGQAHAHHGLCVPQAPSTGCGVTTQASAGTASIAGQVYDANAGTGLGNWCVVLTGSSSVTVATDASGNYTFTGLGGGSYTVCEVLPTGWTETFPSSAFGSPCPTGFGWPTFSLTDGEQASLLNFGNTHP